MSSHGQPLGQRIADHWLEVLLGILAAVAAIAGVQGCAELSLELRDQRYGAYATTGKPGDEALILESRVVPSEDWRQYRLELRAINKSTRPGVLTLGQLHHPGFEPAGGDDVLRASVVYPPEDQHRWQGLRKELSPDQEMTFVTRLRPLGESGSFDVIVSALWLSPPLTTQENSATTKFLTLPLRDLRVESRPRLFFSHAAKSFVTLLGVLALPVAASILAFGFEAQQRRRQEGQKEIERTRQEEQQDSDRKRAVWSTMLPQSHEQNTKYYLPLSSYIATLQRDIDLARKGAAFFAFLQLLRHIRLIADEVGGLYFKNTFAERLIGDLIDLFQGQVFVQFGDATDKLVLILDHVETRGESKSALEARLKENPRKSKEDLPETYHALEKLFDGWSRDESSRWSFYAVSIAKVIVSREVNRLYETWYGKPADLSYEDADDYAHLYWALVVETKTADQRTADLDILHRLKSYAIQDGAPHSYMSWLPPPAG